MTTDPNVLPSMDDEVLPGIEDGPPPLLWYQLPSGMPLVVANDTTILTRVDAELGFQTYYLLAARRTTEQHKGGYYQGRKWDAFEVAHDTPKLMKVVNTIVGFSVHEVPEEDAGLTPVKPFGQFNLPKIPWELIHKVDTFFRSVYHEHHTESIVILTFDPNKHDADGKLLPEGWGVVVPDQNNSAGHCNYDPTSIVDDKPDDAIIVGTIHSHPGMSAFASGVDHHDQANFDGIHITHGWQNHKDQGRTEFHVELQIGGKNWIMDAEKVFSEIPKPINDPDVAKWAKRVTKDAPAQLPGMNQSARANGGGNKPAPPMVAQSGHQLAAGYGGFARGYLAHHKEWADKNEADRPDGMPDYAHTIFISVLPDGEVACPVCKEALNTVSLDNRRCTTCWNFIAKPGETYEDLCRARVAARLDYFDLDPDRQKICDIVMWHVGADVASGENEFERLDWTNRTPVRALLDQDKGDDDLAPFV